MKNPKALVMVVVALLVGLFAVVMASRWMTSQTQLDATHIVVAAADANPGTKLTPDLLKLMEWPSRSVPQGSFTDIKQLDGRVLKTNVVHGEALLEVKLAPEGTKGGLSAVVAEGKRAMTVRVNDVVGVAGFALPGNFVDILVSTQNDGVDGKMISKIVLERILVLAVAQEASRDDTKPRVVNAVTLEVTPEQAELLDLARSVGSLSLVLRNQVDQKAADTSGVTKTTLFSDKPKEAPATETAAPAVRKAPRAAAPAQRDCVEVVTGVTRTIECF